MLERKHKGVLSLNLKKLASRFDDLYYIHYIPCMRGNSLFFMRGNSPHFGVAL